jgi:hypothetical protein
MNINSRKPTQQYEEVGVGKGQEYTKLCLYIHKTMFACENTQKGRSFVSSSLLVVSNRKEIHITSNQYTNTCIYSGVIIKCGCVNIHTTATTAIYICMCMCMCTGLQRQENGKAKAKSLILKISFHVFIIIISCNNVHFLIYLSYNMAHVRLWHASLHFCTHSSSSSFSQIAPFLHFISFSFFL